MKKSTISILPMLLLCIITYPSFAANLANPAAQVGGARVSVGASYNLGGSTITNLEIPMMMNNIGVRVSYAPISYLNFGIDFGTVQISVDRYPVGSGDTIPVFDGNFGWSGGGHLKLTTPFFFNHVALIGLANGNFFRSQNDNKAYYGGADIAGAAGVQVRIGKTCFISVGPHIYLIEGKNRDYEENTGKYGNINNLRGWIAFDYFPDLSALYDKQQPYISLEFTASPKINSSSRVRVQEFSASVTVGTITSRLYGIDKD
ncbi:MAG: hypothetical protein LBI42_06955 [Chitinispirillales bacterium]|jgi:hypothetical protein|nr:hypothetical protein [Chitinispirillales bacterium]